MRAQFTLQGTNTYLLGQEHSRNRVLIDTAQGFASWSKLLASVLQKENATITTCLVTHWHHDHIGGINDLKALCPDVKIWKHTPTLWDGEQSGKKPENLQIDDVQAIETGMVFEGEDGLKIQALHCPGHTDDHCSFIIEDSHIESDKGAIFTGDSMLSPLTSRC